MTVHVLPTGGRPRPPDLSQLRYRNKAVVARIIEQAYEASSCYLGSLNSAL